MGEYSNKPGELRLNTPRTTSGRKVDDWVFTYTYPTDSKASGEKVVVSIFLVRDEKLSSSLVFEARGQRLGQSIRSSDIEKLRVAVEEALNKSVPEGFGIVWEDWLEVVVGAPYNMSEPSMSGGILVEVNRLKRGVDPDTGQVYTINRNNIAVPFPDGKSAGDAPVEGTHRDGIRFSNDDRASSRAYIPATPDNVARLEELQILLKEVRGRLSEILDPKQIQNTLGSLSANVLLGVESDPKGRERTGRVGHED